MQLQISRCSYQLADAAAELADVATTRGHAYSHKGLMDVFSSSNLNFYTTLLYFIYFFTIFELRNHAPTGVPTNQAYYIIMNNNNDFRNYAVKHLGMNGLALDQFTSATNQAIRSSYISPTIIEERQLNVAQMDVFSRLMMDRIIFLGTDVNDYSANVVQAQLLYLDSADPGKDVTLYLNSPGGSVYAGLGIYDTMQYINSDVATVCTGMAASMAAVLLVAGEKGKRFALPHSRVMIHQPMGGAQGQASDIEITAREIQKLKKELYNIIATHSGQPFDKVERDSDRDYWMTAQEAKDYGMIDSVLIRQNTKGINL